MLQLQQGVIQDTIRSDLVAAVVVDLVVVAVTALVADVVLVAAVVVISLLQL